MPDCLSFIWGHLVHFVKFPILHFSVNSSPLPIFILFIQTLYKVSQSYRLSQIAKNCKNFGTWNFLNTGPYAAGILNFSRNFHLSPSKHCNNNGYNAKSKCLLEYCNQKLASSTWDNIFYVKLFKTFLCTGSSVQAKSQGPWASCFVHFPEVFNRKVSSSEVCFWVTKGHNMSDL